MRITEAFALLGLPETAALREIKARYHELAGAGEHRHPDRGGDAGRFTLLVEAYRAALGRVCPTCGGRRTVLRRSGFGSISLPCPECAEPERPRPERRAPPRRRARR